MNSLMSDVVPVIALTVTLRAILVVVHLEDITEDVLVDPLLPDESFCVDLEGGILINFIRQNAEFQTAKQLCRDVSSELARIDTRELFDVIEPFLGEDGRFPVWIGKPFKHLVIQIYLFHRVGGSRCTRQHKYRQVFFRGWKQ